MLKAHPFISMDLHLLVIECNNQVIIAPWLAWRLATGEVTGSNPGKGENLLFSD